MKYPILPGTAGSGEVTDILSANPKKGISSGTNYTIIKEARTVIFLHKRNFSNPAVSQTGSLLYYLPVKIIVKLSGID